jgi:hypothetical protein
VLRACLDLRPAGGETNLTLRWRPGVAGREAPWVSLRGAGAVGEHCLREHFDATLPPRLAQAVREVSADVYLAGDPGTPPRVVGATVSPRSPLGPLGLALRETGESLLSVRRVGLRAVFPVGVQGSTLDTAAPEAPAVVSALQRVHALVPYTLQPCAERAPSGETPFVLRFVPAGPMPVINLEVAAAGTGPWRACVEARLPAHARYLDALLAGRRIPGAQVVDYVVRPAAGHEAPEPPRATPGLGTRPLPRTGSPSTDPR